MTAFLGIVFGGFNWARDIASAILQWLLADLRHAAIAALAVLTIGLWWQNSALAEDRGKWRTAAGTWKGAALDWQTAHETTIENVAQRTAQALAADQQRKTRIEAQQRAIIERTDHDYQSRIDAIRADAGRLRQQLDLAQTANGDGGVGAAHLPGSPEPRCRAFGAANCDEFFDRLPELLAAADTNTAKLIELQAYVRGLLALDWTGGAQEKGRYAE